VGVAVVKDSLKIIGVVVAVLLICIGVPVGVWAFQVATAPVKGKGDVIIKVPLLYSAK